MPALWKPTSKKQDDQNNWAARLEQVTASLPPHTLTLAAFAFGVASTIGTRIVYRKFIKRIPNGDWITPDMFNRRQWVKGKVVSVGDADNFRIYHTPGIGWSGPLKLRIVPSVAKELKDQTIHVRMAGIDAPEGAHFGRTAQPYYDECLAWLKDQIDGKTVYCQVVRRDQYARIVVIPHLKPRFLPGFLATGKCLSLEMLREGWATTYEQAGAEYGKWGKDEFLRIEAEAQAARRGIWKKGMSGETPAEYKRRHAAATEATEPTASKPRRRVPAPAGFLGALWNRLLP